MFDDTVINADAGLGSDSGSGNKIDGGGNTLPLEYVATIDSCDAKREYEVKAEFSFKDLSASGLQYSCKCLWSRFSSAITVRMTIDEP